MSTKTFRTVNYPFEMIVEQRKAVKMFKCKYRHIHRRDDYSIAYWTPTLGRSFNQSCILTVALADIVYHPIRKWYARLTGIVVEIFLAVNTYSRGGSRPKIDQSQRHTWDILRYLLVVGGKPAIAIITHK